MEAILKCNFRFAIGHLTIFSQAPWFMQAESWKILEGKLCPTLKSSPTTWISFLSCRLVSNWLLVSLLGSSTGITDLPFLKLDLSTFSHNKLSSCLSLAFHVVIEPWPTLSQLISHQVFSIQCISYLFFHLLLLFHAVV